MPPLSRREAFGAAVGLAGLLEALAAALLAPGLPPVVRAARIGIDLVLAAGFVAYLRGDHAPPPRRGRLRRGVAIAVILAGGVFAVVARAADPWRRAFRAALAVALAAGIALGVGRTVPPGWRRLRILLVAFVLVQLAVTVAATLEIDVPIAVAGLAPAGRAIARGLERDGYAFPAPLARAIAGAAPDAFVLRRGRLVATTRLADTLHLVGDDPVPIIGRFFDDPRALVAWRRGRLDPCTFLRVVRPPRNGYRDPRYAEQVAATVRACGARAAER